MIVNGLEAEQKVSIFGVNGSIGKNALNVIEQSPKKYSVEIVSAKTKVKELASNAKRCDAKTAIIADESKYLELKSLLAGTDIETRAGTDEIINAAAQIVDVVVMAIVGDAALLPVLKAVQSGQRIALANKEALVCAGEIILNEARENGAEIIPIDSEHNAILQIFENSQKHNIANITLTASGGPFRESTFEQIQNATLKQALNHPNWDMGAKITIDSATMVNKGLEVIEAHHLFGLEGKKIKVVVHPQSIIHGMVEYKDGSNLAVLGTPDMQTPIAVALNYPDRISLNTEKLDLIKTAKLTFEEVDNQKFPSLNLAYKCLELGGTAPAIFNTANEVAVDKFLKGEITFLEITRFIEQRLANSKIEKIEKIEHVLSVIKDIRQ